jgi:hypothetical protein
MPPHAPSGLRGLPSWLWLTSEVGMPMRCSYVVPMRWMVIYGYEVPGGALNLSSTKLLRPWSSWESSPSSKNSHGRTRNWTRDLMISSQKLTNRPRGWSQLQIWTHIFYEGAHYLQQGLTSPAISPVTMITWWFVDELGISEAHVVSQCVLFF